MNKIALLILLFSLTFVAKSETYKVVSPNGNLTVEVALKDGQLNYQVSNANEVLIEPSLIGLSTNLFRLDTLSQVKVIQESYFKEQKQFVWGISNQLNSEYNLLELALSENLYLQFRVYNNGVAWRYVSSYSSELIVFNEQVEINLNKESIIYFPETDGFSTPFEANYLPIRIKDVTESKLGLTPLLVKSQKGASMVITEVNLENYPGMFLQLNNKGLKGQFPNYPAKEKEQIAGRLRLTNIPQLSKKMVVKTNDYIAICNGSRQFPWRAILIEDEDKYLLNNLLVSALADQNYANEDYSWVKPGKAVWDWYHNWNLQGVEFKPGINTKTYKYMIDFAAKNNIEYVNIDDGWCKLHDFRKVNKSLDIEYIIAYAKQKQVGIFLWSTWQTLEVDLIENLDYFQSLGIQGLKVDFFDRCDQKVVDFINLLAEESAKRKLLLNLHGMYKPTGLQVSYPNVVNFEGVLGLEYNKFSDKCTPTHNVTIPFVRNAVGPMDYTPGGMLYADSVDFEESWKNPHVMTTKAQQLAMYVVYHGGIQMLADSPTLYEKDSIVLDYLKEVPVSWDRSIPIHGEIGGSAVVARQSGSSWYIAGINGSISKDYKIKLDFIDDAEYEMMMIQEGDSRDIVTRHKGKVAFNQELEVQLKASSGFVIELSRIN